jgi:urea carboxylase
MDALALRLANRLAGNEEGVAALELTVAGPTLRFNCDAVIALAGADMGAELDGQPLANWAAHAVKAGSILRLGAIKEAGCRSYLAVRGGFDVPDYLGSKSTFTLGQFGGHAGRTLRVGDVLHLQNVVAPADAGAQLNELPTGVHPQGVGHGCKAAALRDTPSDKATTTMHRRYDVPPAYTHAWEIGVLYGPHGAPDFFTDADIDMFFATDWEVHYNSSRTGVRLIGPRPQWARKDGGEAGLHPSNIHDNAYAIGAVDFTGDMPVILGPDGPSLGGFVCPATIVQADLWKMGQLRPGDTVRFRRLSQGEAERMEAEQDRAVASLLPSRSRGRGRGRGARHRRARKRE